MIKNKTKSYSKIELINRISNIAQNLKNTNIEVKEGRDMLIRLSLCNAELLKMFGIDIKNLDYKDNNYILEKNNKKLIRVALYGGSFNPPHLGHLIFSKKILEYNIVDEIWLMPCFKSLYNKKLESPEDRLEMCKLLIKGENNLKVFDYEIINKFSGSSYEICKKLSEDNNYSNYEFSFLISTETANRLKTWENGELLIDLIKLIIAPRISFELSMEMYKELIIKRNNLYVPITSNELINISSSTIRSLINGFYKYPKLSFEEEISKYIPSNLFNYIKEKNLYNIG